MCSKILFTLIVGFLTTTGIFGQEGVPFQKVKEFYLNGNTRVIGNTILSNHRKNVFNKPKGLNDRTKMVYVDIDNNPETFSSSSADLELPEGAIIKYAGLYWAGTYPGAEGVQKVRNSRIVFNIKKKRKEPFDLVQLKIPGTTTYTPVQGELVYDGKFDTDTDLNNTAPYVCHSDVTDLLVSQNAASGTYMLANVPALEGIMYGGSSAGWMLYLVYELDTEPLQYITSYRGFKYISLKNPVELSFNNFRAIESGEVNTFVTLAALEGDLVLTKDVVSIYNEQQEVYIPLKNEVRFANNFFNSSITISDKEYLRRNPASTNTLGFDLAKIKIPNLNNELISNDATQVKLQFKTQEDRLFAFFTAFQTEISPEYFQRVVVEGKADVKKQVSEREKVRDEVLETVVFDKDGQPLQTKIDTVSIKNEKTKRDALVLEMLAAPSAKVPDRAPGYYVINHVFSKKSNATNWMAEMRNLGLDPRQFVSPSNGYYYIYIDYSEDPDVLYKRLKEYRSIKQLNKAWMLKNNLD